MKKIYQIQRLTFQHMGYCRIIRETTEKSNATWDEVEAYLALPEKHPGERKEAIEELHEYGITCYRNYRISEYTV